MQYYSISFLIIWIFNFDVRFSFWVFASHRVKLQSAHMDGVIVSVMFFWFIFQLILTRSQAVARIADRTAKNSRGHVT